MYLQSSYSSKQSILIQHCPNKKKVYTSTEICTSISTSLVYSMTIQTDKNRGQARSENPNSMVRVSTWRSKSPNLRITFNILPRHKFLFLSSSWVPAPWDVGTPWCLPPAHSRCDRDTTTTLYTPWRSVARREKPSLLLLCTLLLLW